MKKVFYKVMERGFANEYELRTYESEEEADKVLTEERDRVQAAGNLNWCYCKKTVKELNKNYRDDIVKLICDVDMYTCKSECPKYFTADDIATAINDYDKKFIKEN